MSASEKLTKLAEEPIRNMFILKDAIPEMVALIEAAEYAANVSPGTTTTSGERAVNEWAHQAVQRQLRPALAALEKKLT